MTPQLSRVPSTPRSGAPARKAGLIAHFGREPSCPGPVQRSEGFILVAVLVVIMLASMVVVSLLFRLRAEETATAAGAGSEQAWAAALSGVYEAMRVAQAAP